MASPQLEDGFLRIAHELDAAFSAGGFTQYESIILREVREVIFGPSRKKETKVSPTDLAKRWEVHRSAFSSALSRLVKQNVLKKSETGISLNKNYESWKSPDGTPLFSKAFITQIALSSARSIGAKYGYLLPKMVMKAAMGVETQIEVPLTEVVTISGCGGSTKPITESIGKKKTCKEQDSASQISDEKRLKNQTPADTTVINSVQPSSEVSDSERHENKTLGTLYRTRAMDTVETEEDKTQDNSREAKPPTRQASCPEYPDFQTTFLPKHTGPHRIQESEAKRIWERLWETWKSKTICEGWWTHQEWFSTETWEIAFGQVQVRHPEGKPIGYVLTICRDIEANPEKYKKECLFQSGATIPFKRPDDTPRKHELSPQAFDRTRMMQESQRKKYGKEPVVRNARRNVGDTNLQEKRA